MQFAVSFNGHFISCSRFPASPSEPWRQMLFPFIWVVCRAFYLFGKDSRLNRFVNQKRLHFSRSCLIIFCVFLHSGLKLGFKLLSGRMLLPLACTCAIFLQAFSFYPTKRCACVRLGVGFWPVFGGCWKCGWLGSRCRQRQIHVQKVVVCNFACLHWRVVNLLGCFRTENVIYSRLPSASMTSVRSRGVYTIQYV